MRNNSEFSSGRKSKGAASPSDKNSIFSSHQKKMMPNSTNVKQTSKAYEMIRQAMGSTNKEGGSNYANFSNIFSLSGQGGANLHQIVENKK